MEFAFFHHEHKLLKSCDDARNLLCKCLVLLFDLNDGLPGEVTKENALEGVLKDFEDG